MQTLDVSSSPPTNAPERSVFIRAEQIRVEQIRAQFRIMPGAFVGSALVATIVVAMVRERSSLSVLMPWLISVYILSVGRFILWRLFWNAAVPSSRIERWGRFAIAAGALSGVLWGIGGMVLHDRTSLPHQVFLLAATTGLGFASTYVTAPFMPAFLAYVCPSFVLSALPFLADGDRLHIAIGIATLLLLPAVIQFADRVSRTFRESVNVKLHNCELMAELRRQKEAAEQANVAKSRFLAVASHDLRQPLQALGLFVQALQDSSIASHERHLVGNIRRSVDAMEDLFDSLLDISRLDAGIVRPGFETFALATLFDRLKFEFGPLAQQKGLALNVMQTSVYICSDPSLIERIVRNLVANAIRYTDRGGVLLGCRRQQGGLRIEVWDTGRGIAADKHREIFREFSQLDAAAGDPNKGLGLGLAIVERLAQLLDHDIRVRSISGKGSVFSVAIPRGREEDVIASTAIEQTTAFELSGVLILVIDSDPAVRHAMQTLLSKWNGEVITAASGAQMKNELPLVRRVPSLIICEYCPRAPDTLGVGPTLTAIEMLRNEFNSEIPAVLLTGDTGIEAQLRDQEVAGLPVLHKPLNPARLRTLISNLLRIDARQRTRRAS